MTDDTWVRKPLEDWTRTDWYMASVNLNKNAYNKDRRIAKKAGLSVPDNTPFTAEFVTNNDSEQLARSMNEDAVKEFNSKIKVWGQKVESQLKNSAATAVKNDTILSQSIRLSYKYRRGELISIGFSFAREGAWLLHGAGKGYGGDGSNTSWLDKYGIRRKAAAESLYKAGTGNRKAIGWFNPVIESNVEELADIVANYSSSISLNLSHIYIDTHFS